MHPPKYNIFVLDIWCMVAMWPTRALLIKDEEEEIVEGMDSKDESYSVGRRCDCDARVGKKWKVQFPPRHEQHLPEAFTMSDLGGVHVKESFCVRRRNFLASV